MRVSRAPEGWKETLDEKEAREATHGGADHPEASGSGRYACGGADDRPGGSGPADLWVTTRTTLEEDWTEPVHIMPAWYSSISSDGLLLFFQDDNLNIWMTQRKTLEDSFGPGVRLPSQINTSRVEGAPYVCNDGCTLYFSSNNSGGYGQNDTWQVSIDPIVDLNEDGIVDSADMCIIVDNWGTDEPLCDIGPMPWGDGIVDVQDLIVLAGH